MNTPAPRAMLHPRVGGFTLIELMIALAILAILVRLATPALRDVMMNARMTGQANDLMADLNIARSEAIKRNLRAYLCTSNNGTSCTATPGPQPWTQGWLIFVDANGDGVKNVAERPLKSHAAFDASNTLVVAGDIPPGPGGIRYVPYRPSGVSTPGAGSVTFRMCDYRTTATVGAALAQNKGRTITINPTGRPVVLRITC